MHHLAKSLKEIDAYNQQYHFTKLYQSIPGQISFRFHWKPKDGANDFSAILHHPDSRIIMQPGELFSTYYRPSENGVKKTKRPIVVMGTPYGTAIIHCISESMVERNKFIGLQFCTIHVTDNFRKAAARYMTRRPEQTLLIKDWGHSKSDINLDNFIKMWMVTTNFHQEIAEQAEVDKANGIEVTDGFPPIIPIVRTPKPEKKKHYHVSKKPPKPPVQAEMHLPAGNPAVTA